VLKCSRLANQFQIRPMSAEQFNDFQTRLADSRFRRKIATG